ncbi:UNVERIFIED_CONTAM: hypothetical protein GTU68_018036 [Idotea baltica]|nr:hypothetical protein [Idotea baltica]
MIDSLREIELAYNLLKCETGESSQDPIDECYKKLKTNISVLPQSSEEFKLIKTSVENTHASTHSHYTLEIEEVGYLGFKTLSGSICCVSESILVRGSIKFVFWKLILYGT